MSFLHLITAKPRSWKNVKPTAEMLETLRVDFVVPFQVALKHKFLIEKPAASFYRNRFVQAVTIYEWESEVHAGKTSHEAGIYDRETFEAKQKEKSS